MTKEVLVSFSEKHTKENDTHFSSVYRAALDKKARLAVVAGMMPQMRKNGGQFSVSDVTLEMVDGKKKTSVSESLRMAKLGEFALVLDRTGMLDFDKMIAAGVDETELLVPVLNHPNVRRMSLGKIDGREDVAKSVGVEYDWDAEMGDYMMYEGGDSVPGLITGLRVYNHFAPEEEIRRNNQLVICTKQVGSDKTSLVPVSELPGIDTDYLIQKSSLITQGLVESANELDNTTGFITDAYAATEWVLIDGDLVLVSPNTANPQFGNAKKSEHPKARHTRQLLGQHIATIVQRAA